MKANNNRIRGRSERHIALDNSAGSGVNATQTDFIRAQFLQGLLHRFDRTVHVTLNNDFKLLNTIVANLGIEVIQSQLGPLTGLLLLEFLPLLAILAGELFVVRGLEGVARKRGTRKANNLHRSGRGSPLANDPRAH